MSRIGRVLMFIAASVVSGLALAFIIIAWRPQLVAGRSVAPPPVAQNSAPGADSGERSRPPPVAIAGATGAIAATDGPPPMVLFPGHDAWSYADAVQRAAPAVVKIYTSRTVTERVQPSGFGAFFGDLAPSYRNRTERSLGSGVIVDSEGHIVTNNHVIEDADQVGVQLADHRVAVAKVVGRDPDSDLALLKISLAHLPVMALGHSDKLQVGDVVLAIGSPLGLSQTVTHGIVSATGRGQLGLATFENFIQTDAAINLGNSGGALINTRGELVGINTAMLAKTSVEGIGFAIPVNMVRGVVHELITRGKVVRGWIGIFPEDFSNEQASLLQLAQGGVVVWQLYQDSPAVAAGLARGDIITGIDGAEVKSSQDLMARIASTQPGTKIKLTGLRGRASFEATMTVRQRPKDL